MEHPREIGKVNLRSLIEECNKRLPAVKNFKKLAQSGLRDPKRNGILTLKNNSINTLNLSHAKRNKFMHHHLSIAKKQKKSLEFSFSKNSIDTYKDSAKSKNLYLDTTETRKSSGIALKLGYKNNLLPTSDTVMAQRNASEKKLRPKRTRCRPFCRYMEFARMGSFGQGSPCVNIGSPYKSQEDVYNEEYKQSKSKWITKNGFVAIVSSKKYKDIENYVTKDPSEPPLLHKFRSVDKSKWLSGSFKLT